MLISCQNDSLLFENIDKDIIKFTLVSKFCVKEVLVENNVIKIPSKMLTELTKNELCFIDIYVNNEIEKSQLKMTKDVTFSGKTELLTHGRVYSCYISKNGFIRILNEGFISNKPITKEVFVQNINLTQKNIELNINIETLYFLPKVFNLVIRDRKSMKQINIKSDKLIKKSSKLAYDNYQYKTSCKLKINKEILSSFVYSLYDKQSNHFNSLDFYYNFEIEEYTSSTYAFRLKNKDSVNNEINEFIIDIDKKRLQLYRVITTGAGNLTFNYHHYPKKVLECISKRQLNNESTKPIILIAEYPYSARDNGLAIFKYLIKHHQNDFIIYYVLDEESTDIKNINKYKDNILYVGSQKHCDVFFQCNIILHSHSPSYVVPAMTNVVLNELNNKTRYFIQHGIVGKRDLSSLYGYNNGSFSDYFITSSKRESKIVEEKHGFPKDRILEYGLPRFDRLFSRSQKIKNYIKRKKRRTIFIFFTWRPELNKLNEDEFQKSEYFKNIMDLLNSDIFTDQNDMLGYMRLHPNMEKFAHLFSAKLANKRVIIRDESDDHIVQDYILKSDIMITDYSSAALDFAITGKPVVYYEITTERNVLDESDDFLPGIKLKKLSDLEKEILKLKTNRSSHKIDVQKLNNIYIHRDKKASRRLVNHILENHT
ncbi:CDP-glycerol glycerophosphotransferase family protein [Vagococcus lutrae]|uniref:CDP-glycerol glycerophosphotransferase family protein n=1 Tax=Vagococcus lutrae TaxID=81947 RepID=UPI002890B759|nr:CDP-glycerol glycerophosphotransferase family protein [Vagococcus lutrae]MDT2826019.1 CDP-glycerol glycerophosphotransferase family protein [Vagococcus lutrae]